MLTTLVWLNFRSNISKAQSSTSLFRPCADLTSIGKIKHCEKKMVLDFIYSDLWQYITSFEKSDPGAICKINFDIEANGKVSGLNISENTSSPLNQVHKMIQIPPVLVDKSANSSLYNRTSRVSYTVPPNNEKDFDLTRLIISGIVEDEIFKVVEQMPRFPGCENKSDLREKDFCATEKMWDFIDENVKYPKVDEKIEIKGKVVIQFIVEKDGSVSNIIIAKDIGYGYGKAFADVIASMNDMPELWICGKQRGRPVTVLYTLPIEF